LAFRLDFTGDLWPPRPDAEQAGLVVAYDTDTGDAILIPGMGRMVSTP